MANNRPLYRQNPPRFRSSLGRRLAALLIALMALFMLPAPALAEEAAPRFAIKEFVVSGNTLLDSAEITAVLAPFIGKDRDAADLQRATEAIRERYNAAGFAIAGVITSEIDFNRGMVSLQIVEARLGELNIQDNPDFDRDNIRASLPALSPGTTPTIADISANVQLANQNPAKQVDVTLRRGAKAGVIDADVEVIAVRPVKFFVTLDNTGSTPTGDYRLGVGVQHANLFNRDHVGTLSYVTSPEKPEQVRLYSASYRLPLYRLGDSIDLIAADSDVSAGTTQTVAGPLSFSGKGTVYGLRYNQLLARRGDYSHRLVYGLDYRAYRNDCSLGSFGAAGCGPGSEDVTTRPYSLTYSGSLNQPRQISSLYFGVARNWPGSSHGDESSFNAVRPSPSGVGGASSHYSVLRAGASSVTAFAGNWQLYAGVNGQYTSDPLISGEQFGITGATTVRGFREREIVRDTGYAATFELYSPMLSAALPPGSGNLRGVLFYDHAEAVNQTLPGESRQAVAISSAGAGVRWTLNRSVNLRADLARVINPGGSRSGGDYHGHISLYFGT